MSGGFADLGLQQELLTAIDNLGWLLPTAIQDEAIPLILGGGDVMGAAETGSGKTAAFALPIIQSVHERLRGVVHPRRASNNNPSGKSNNNSVKVNVRLNENDKEDGVIVSPDGFTCSHTTTGNNWVGIRATHGVNRGKFFYEVEVLEKGNCRVGWSTIAAHLELGKDGQGFGYGGKGWKSYNGNYEKYGGEYSQNDFIGVYLDFTKKQISFAKNGRLLEVAYEIPEDIIGTVLFPTIALSNSAARVNFGEKPFRFPPSTEEGGDKFLAIAKSFSLFDHHDSETYATKGPRKPMAIVIEPTKDLAEQVFQSFVDLSRYCDQPKLAIHLLIGDNSTAVSSSTGGKFSKNSDSDIIIGTIGKITGLLSNGTLDLSQIRFFVLDEADKLVNADNLSSIKAIFNKCPGGGVGIHRLQVCFFSATLYSPGISELAELICMNPTWIDLKGQDASLLPETVHHVFLKVPVLSDSEYTKFLQTTSVNGVRPITDEVHTNYDFNNSNTVESNKHKLSQRIKEMKPLLLLKLIDKFEVRKRFSFFYCVESISFLIDDSMYDFLSNQFRLSESFEILTTTNLIQELLQFQRQQFVGFQIFSSNSRRTIVHGRTTEVSPALQRRRDSSVNLYRYCFPWD
jgi:ATP-dependent RNA helicase DDX1